MAGVKGRSRGLKCGRESEERKEERGTWSTRERERDEREWRESGERECGERESVEREREWYGQGKGVPGARAG